MGLGDLNIKINPNQLQEIKRLWDELCNLKARQEECCASNGAVPFSLNTLNTDTLSLFGNGSLATPLYGNVNVSTHANNGILTFPDGLYYANTIKAGVVYGGIVTWVSGYTYDVTAAGYYIDGYFYQSPSARITLDPSDPTFNRIDTFIVDTTGAVSVLKGVPSDNPAQAPLDPATQLQLSFALVEAGTIEPNVVGEYIYKEGIEWTPSSNTTRLSYLSTASPDTGTYSLESTKGHMGINDTITLHRSNPFYITTAYSVLTFRIKPKADYPNSLTKGGVTLFFGYNGSGLGTGINILDSVWGFEATTQAYQTVSIPLANFHLTNALVNELYVRDSYNIGWYIDNIRLEQVAIPNIPLTSGTVTSVNASINGALGVAGGPITSSGTLAFTWKGNTTQYVRGDGVLTTFPAIPTQYTDTLARLAVSLNTVGTSGPATYDPVTGIFNIPNYSGNVPFVAKKIKFKIDDSGAPAAGTTSFILRDCANDPVLNMELNFFRERDLQYESDDYTYDKTTGTITLLSSAFGAGERIEFHAYNPATWTVCTISSPTASRLFINSTDHLLINGVDRFIL